MDLNDLARLGAQFVAGQVDLDGKTIGKSLPGNKVVILDPDVEQALVDRLAEMDAPAAEPAPTPAPRKPAAKKAAPAADSTADLDAILGPTE